jgi:hypothetical protein
MVFALPATAAAPHSDAMAAAPASAPEEEAVAVEDVPELRNLDAYEGRDDDEELPGIAPPPVARAAAEKRTGDKRRPLSHLTRLEFLTDLVRPHSSCAALHWEHRGREARVDNALTAAPTASRDWLCADLLPARQRRWPPCVSCRCAPAVHTHAHAHAPGWVMCAYRSRAVCAPLAGRVSEAHKAAVRSLTQLPPPPTQRAPTPTGSLRRSSTASSWTCLRCTSRRVKPRAQSEMRALVR